jgi:hypothetical protein
MKNETTVSSDSVKRTAVINENGKTKLRVMRASGGGAENPAYREREYKQAAARHLPTTSQELSHQNLVFVMNMLKNYK